MKNKILLYIAFLFVLFIGIYLRFHQLSLIPASLSNDELDHVVNGLSIKWTGKDIQNQHHIWELYPTYTQAYTAELSALWHAVLPNLSSNLNIQARLPNAFSGLIFSLLLAIFTFQIFKSKLISLITFLTILVSPWHILISRTAYEAPIALCLLLSSIITFLHVLSVNKNKYKIPLLILTILLMLFSFYTYHGYKILYPLIYLTIFLWKKNISFKHYIKNKKELYSILPLVIIIFCWLLAFLLFSHRVSQGWYGERTNEISFLNSALLSEEVNQKRKASFENLLTPLFINKATISIEKIANNFIGTMSPDVLFKSGFDGSYMIGLWDHGLLYLVQLPLIFLGLLILFQRYRPIALLLLILLFISLIPALIHTGISISLRSSMFLPILNIMSAVGLASILTNRYKFKHITLFFITIVYILSILRFQHYYFNRFPTHTIDTSIFSQRLLSSYLQHIQTNNSKIIVISDNPYAVSRTYTYYENLIKKNNIHTVQKTFKDPASNKITINNIIFTNQCNDVDFENDNTIIAMSDYVINCKLESKYSSNSALLNNSTKSNIYILPSPKDNREYYRIYNDKLCTHYPIEPYITINNAKLFALESLSPEEFCTKWVRF